MPIASSSFPVPADSRRLALLAAIAGGLGLFVGLVAYLLFLLIALVTNFAFYGRWSLAEAVPGIGHVHGWVILIPAVGGLLVGLMARFGSRKICGHGIDAVIESVLFHRSRVDPKVAVLKPVSSALVIGTGGPFGVEGPIIQTGGAVGSIMGQILHLTAAERKTLLAAGAAAGLAATFSTPVAAVLLAIELILFEYKPRSFIPVVTATTLATAVRYLLQGAGPLVAIEPPAIAFARVFPWCLVLGGLCGLAAVGFVRALAWFEDLFDRLARWRLDPMWWPALGGVGLGVIGYLVPQTLGSGYSIIADLLSDRLGWALVLLILLFKPLALLTALGSRTSGGTLAPMFMAGAALGSLVGHGAQAIAPGLALSPGACALLAMAAFFGAAARAPFALIVFGFEMTRDYQAVLPLMLTVVVAHGVALALMRHSVMTLGLVRRGLPVTQEFEADVFQTMTVGAVMAPPPVTVPGDTSVADLAARLARGESDLNRHGAVMLVDPNQDLCGIITRRDIVRALAARVAPEYTVLEAGTRDPVVTYPDELVDTALDRMLRQGCGRLPVVSRDDPRKLVGYLGRTAVLQARRRRHDDEHHREPGWLAKLRTAAVTTDPNG